MKDPVLVTDLESTEDGLVSTTAIQVPISRQLFGDAGTPLRDLFPYFCLVHLVGAPSPSKGLAVSCVRCKQSYRAKKVRPWRGESHCCECGQKVPRGPKRPKEWCWVRFTAP